MLKQSLIEALENAYREYVLIHDQWMNTSIHEPDKQAAVKAELAKAREAYIHAYQALHPTHIIM